MMSAPASACMTAIPVMSCIVASASVVLFARRMTHSPLAVQAQPHTSVAITMSGTAARTVRTAVTSRLSGSSAAAASGDLSST